MVLKSDVSIYADSKFSDDRMSQIRFGLKNGVDVSIYKEDKL